MNDPANHWKLGLFVLLAAALLTIAVIFLGTAGLRKETVSYTSYFDEAVTGLDVGSPVRFRGVNIGSVSKIDVAPDRRHVEVTYDLGISVIGGLGLAAPDGAKTKLQIPTDLRAQLGSAGVTGVKYILIDFFDKESHPPPKLPFAVPSNYIPTAESMLKSLEDSVVRAVDQFPVLAEQLSGILARVNDILIDIDAKHLPDKAVATLGNVDATLANLDATLAVARTKLNGLDTAGLSNEAKAAIANLNVTMTHAQALMARLDGDRGVLSSVQRATDSIGDVATDARGYGAELSDTLRALSEAADGITQLVGALELDSDMLLKGRSQVSE
jgi:phospholipid/cholesterol/gamma-HCH transport system substrate-binding protein